MRLILQTLIIGSCAISFELPPPVRSGIIFVFYLGKRHINRVR